MSRQVVQYYDDSIDWHFDGKRHRYKDLPARYCFHDGELISVIYCQRDKYHRTTGPAFISYVYNFKWYYYKGRRYDSIDQVLMVEACR